MGTGRFNSKMKYIPLTSDLGSPKQILFASLDPKLPRLTLCSCTMQYFLQGAFFFFFFHCFYFLSLWAFGIASDENNIAGLSRRLDRRSQRIKLCWRLATIRICR